MNKKKVANPLFLFFSGVIRFLMTNIFFLMLFLRKVFVISLRFFAVALFLVWVFCLWLYPGQLPKPWLVLLLSFISFILSWMYDFLLLYIKPTHIKAIMLN